MAISNPQQLSMADRIAVRRLIIDRCAAIVANFALYILGEAGNTANHANRLSWAREAVRSASSIGDSVSWHVLNQTSFLNGGSSIEDAELGGIVESAIINHYITPA